MHALDQIDEVAADANLMVVPLAALSALDYYGERTFAAKPQFTPARECPIGLPEQRDRDLRCGRGQRGRDGAGERH